MEFAKGSCTITSLTAMPARAARPYNFCMCVVCAIYGCLSVCLSAWLSVGLPACLTACLCLSVGLSLSVCVLTSLNTEGILTLDAQLTS